MPHPVIDSRVYTDSTPTRSDWPARPNAEQIVEAWHNDTHPGVFRFCDEQPCHAINHANLP